MTDSGTTLQAPVAVMGKKAGEPVQLTTVSEYCAKTVIIQALASNTEPIVIGDKNVVAKAEAHGTQPVLRGIELKKEAIIAIDIIDATQIWFDVRTEKDGLSYLILRA